MHNPISWIATKILPPPYFSPRRRGEMCVHPWSGRKGHPRNFRRYLLKTKKKDFFVSRLLWHISDGDAPARNKKTLKIRQVQGLVSPIMYNMRARGRCFPMSKKSFLESLQLLPRVRTNKENLTISPLFRHVRAYLSLAQSHKITLLLLLFLTPKPILKVGSRLHFSLFFSPGISRKKRERQR